MLLLLHPEREYSITELAEACGVTHTAIVREVDRLVVGGILDDRRVGRNRLVKSRSRSGRCSRTLCLSSPGSARLILRILGGSLQR
ncbi:hypothetical protein AB5J62_36175 [Amycolatopsis sp. cg5]|uniref:hypothetical protein n=1 Tax=Amycolatopsis sp. cg5 TaxID=3238802 RepID=UPI00352690D6